MSIIYLKRTMSAKKELENQKKGKEQLEKAIEITKQKKEEVLQIVQILIKELNSGKITRKEYKEKLNSALNNRTAEQWIKYYEDYTKYYEYQIKLCDKLTKQEKIKTTIYKAWEEKSKKRKLTPILSILIAIVLIAIITPIFINLTTIGNNFVNTIDKKTTTTISYSTEQIPELRNITKPILLIDLDDKQVIIEKESLIQYQAVVGQPVKWKKEFTIDSITGFSVELPMGSKNIQVKSSEKDITNIVNINKKRRFFIFGEKAVEIKLSKKTITGNAIADNQEQDFEIIFETPAPEIKEEIIKQGKRIIITGPDDVHYQEVFSFAKTPEILKIGEEHKLKLYKIKNNQKELAEFTAYDTDENGLYDYIEFIVPELSEAIYEISIEILNIQSYPTLYGNWTVEFTTIGKANLTIRSINKTTWSNQNENNDLKFLKIQCSPQTLNPQWINNSIFIQDYKCDNTGFETSKVLTSGKHHLEFDFGGIKKYVHNDVRSLTVRVSQDTDDAEQRVSDGNMYLTSTDLELGYDNYAGDIQIIGLRFQDVEIPENAKITNAYVEFEADSEGWTGDVPLEIRGENSDNPGTFISTPYDVSSRPNTIASIPWTITQQWIINNKYPSPNISIIIQEIINRPEWHTGNSIVIKFYGTNTNRREAESYRGESTAAALLVVDYTTPDTPPIVILDSPTNQDILNKTNINFNCSTTDNKELINITLYGNWTGTWHANQTKTISGTSNLTTFEVNLTDKQTYEWCSFKLYFKY